MARRAGRRGGIIKLYPPPLPSQQLPANHQPHFMKGGRGGEGRERKERRRGKRERQRGQRKGRGGTIKERREEKRREEKAEGRRRGEMRQRWTEGKMMNVEGKWNDWRRGGR